MNFDHTEYDAESATDDFIAGLVEEGLLVETEYGYKLTDALAVKHPELYEKLQMESELEVFNDCMRLVDEGLLEYELNDEGICLFQLTEAGRIAAGY